MNQAEKREFRAEVLDVVEKNVEMEGLEFVGRTSQGVAFKNEDGDVFVISAIAKKEDFDLEGAIQKEEERIAKTKEKEREKAEKKAKREKKAEEEGE